MGGSEWVPTHGGLRRGSLPPRQLLVARSWPPHNVHNVLCYHPNSPSSAWRVSTLLTQRAHVLATRTQRGRGIINANRAPSRSGTLGGIVVRAFRHGGKLAPTN